MIAVPDYKKTSGLRALKTWTNKHNHWLHKVPGRPETARCIGAEKDL